MASNVRPARRKQFVTALTIQLAILMTLAIFRSDKLLSFSYDLPSNAVNDQFVILAENWNGLMDTAGITIIVPEIEALIAKLRGELNG